MPTVIRNTTVITGSGDGAVLHDAAIAIVGGRIAAVGPSSEIVQRFGGAEVIDGSRTAVAPGFANCHTHLGRVLARGIFEDQNAPNVAPFSRQGFLAFPKMRPDERDAMIRLALVEAIRSGTTLVMEVGSGIADYADLLSRGNRLSEDAQDDNMRDC